MDDPTLKIQTFYPTWEEFKDFKKYINHIESQGAHRAGLARIVPPKEFVPRRQGYNDLTKLKVTIKKPICQVVAKVSGRGDGCYQQVNVPQRSMTVSDFRQLANSPKYATPPHRSNAELEKIYWDRINSHCGIYGADVCGSITDPTYPYWNINKLDTILDYVGKDYDVSIDGVNTAYLYFGMWKTSFGWHTEDVDLYSINYLHFGAPKSWYSVPPSYGRKFEKLAAALFQKSSDACRAFMRHKMTILHPKWLDDYDIPYDKVTQEAGQIMITFPFGYHAGFNHGFNCAESTNFATERWIEYGKHATRCYCCPDAVNISMDTFVKRFQPALFDDWIAGRDKTPHPEYHINPAELNEPQTSNRQMSFIERNPDLDINDILLNPNYENDVKDELRGSFMVSAEDEVAGMEADFEERQESRKKIIFTESSNEDESEEEEKPKKGRKRKKHDSDYDDDWFETKGHKYVNNQGEIKKGRPVGSGSGKKRGRPAVKKSCATPIVRTERKSAPAALVQTEVKKKQFESPLNVPGATVTVIETKEKKVTVMSGLPKEVPSLLQSQANPSTKTSNAPKGPSYSDAFAAFLQSAKKAPEPEKPKSIPSVKQQQPSNQVVKKETTPSQPASVIQHTAKVANKQKNQNSMQQQNVVLDQNQRVRTEKIPQSTQSQVYAIQENTIVTQSGEQQKLYYTILDSNSSKNAGYQQNIVKQQYVGQQQQSF